MGETQAMLNRVTTRRAIIMMMKRGISCESEREEGGGWSVQGQGQGQGLKGHLREGCGYGSSR